MNSNLLITDKTFWCTDWLQISLQFHNRTIMDEEEVENETLANMAAAADVDEEEEEIPEFLEGEQFEVFDW